MIKKIKKILNKKNRAKIVCLTAYSKNVAEEIDKYVDIVLVGDSLGSVLYNYKTTRSVSLTEMINHSKSVRLGVQKSLMVVDMPYKTYDTSVTALKNSKKIMKETKCDAVKLEGGKKIIKQIRALTKNNIPVILDKVEKVPFRRFEQIHLPYKIPYLLKQGGVQFCINTRIGYPHDGNVRNLPNEAMRAAAYGLEKAEALRSITLSAAEILGIDEMVGSLDIGKSRRRG